MSDPYGSFGNPYGAPPPYPNQPPAWPPPQGPAQVPGQGLPPGAPMPPMPPTSPYLPPFGLLPLDRRPGVVTAGAVVAIVLSALSLLAALLGVLGLVAEHVDPDPGDYVSTGDMIGGLVFCAVLVVACVFAIVLAGLALHRRQWARITLVVLGFVSFAALLPLITSVLLLLPSAGRWYAGRTQQAPPYGPPQGPPSLPPEVGLRQS